MSERSIRYHMKMHYKDSGVAFLENIHCHFVYSAYGQKGKTKNVH